MSTNIIVFHGNELVIVEIEGQPHVAMRPICKAIGLSIEGQVQAIKRDPVLAPTACVTHVVAEDGKLRELICLPLSKLNGWLFKINASRVKPEVRERVIDYQRNCYDVLYEHFHGRANRQHEKYWFGKYPHWQAILPLALQGLKNIQIALRTGINAGRVSRAIKRMIQVGLLDPVARIRARFKADTAGRMVQLPLCAEWGV